MTTQTLNRKQIPSVKLKSSLSDIFERSEVTKYTYIIKGKIAEFINNYIFELICIVENNNLDFDLNIYLEDVDNFSKNIEDNLSISNNEVFEKTLATVKISEILLKQGLENNDIECVFNSFYTLESDLKIINVYIEE